MPSRQSKGVAAADATLTAFACPNEDCSDFNRFGAGNLSVCEWMGKNKEIRRLYCRTCGHRFSERQGTLLQHSKLPEESVVRMVKCLVHGCSIDATADICEVSPRTVECLLRKAGRRAEDFHRLQLENIVKSLGVVELDELHGRSAPPKKKGRPRKLAPLSSQPDDDVVQAVRGFMRHWWGHPDS